MPFVPELHVIHLGRRAGYCVAFVTCQVRLAQFPSLVLDHSRMSEPVTPIAIVGLNAYQAINPQMTRNVGGLESFAWTFARALAGQSGWDVSLLLRHSQAIREEQVDGVRLLALSDRWHRIAIEAGHCLRRKVGFPFVEMLRWKPSLLWQLPLLAGARLVGLQPPLEQSLREMLTNSQAAIVVTLGVSRDSVAAIKASKSLGKPVWLWLRSNGDIDERFFSDPAFVDPYAVRAADCRYCIQEASGILCQTQWQADRLKDLSGRSGVIVRNPVDVTRFRLPLPRFEERDGVLWLGRMDRFHKRPLLAIEIARRCPEIPFVLVANRKDSAVEAEVRASCPPNVRLLDYVPRTEIAERYRQSRLFLSTGDAQYEGFPNVFLEAAASGTPIVSLEDFDSFLTTSGCGVSTTGAVEQAALALQQLHATRSDWESLASRGRPYVDDRHSLAVFIENFEAAIRDTTPVR